MMYKQTYLFTRKDDNSRLKEKRHQYVLHITQFSVQFSSVTQSCPPLCDPMDCSTPGLPVHHQLLVLHITNNCSTQFYTLSESR